MEGYYEVFFRDHPAGKVQVIRQGLYYRFICNCQLSGDLVCRLILRCNGQEENLGVVVPSGDGFSLDKKVPVKKFAGNNPKFCLMPAHASAEGTFIPISPEEPFAYIARLKDAFLVYQNGQAGILI